MDTYSSNILQVAGNTWVALGDINTSWLINSVGGVPVELVMLDPDVIPDTDTRRQFTVGGIVNNITSPVGKQCWFRCVNANELGLLLLRPTDLGEFNEISMVKASIVDMNTQMIGLSTRVTKNELLTNANQMRLNIHEYVIQGVQASMANVIAQYANMNVRIAMSAMNTKRYASNRISAVETAQKDYEQTLLSMQMILSQIIANHADLNTKMRLDFHETSWKVDSKLVDIDRTQSTQNETIASLQGTLATTIASYTEAVTKLSIKTIRNQSGWYTLNTQFQNLKAQHDYVLYVVQDILKDVFDSQPINYVVPEFIKRNELNTTIASLTAHIDSIVMGSLLIYTHLLVNEVQSTTSKVYFNQLADANAYTTDDLRNDLVYILMNMLTTVNDPSSDVLTMKTNMLNYISNRSLEDTLVEYLDILAYLCSELKLTSGDTNFIDLNDKYVNLVNSIISNTLEALVAQTEPPVEQLPEP